MVLEDLKQAFSQKKGYYTESANELLDFARHCYLEGKLCISDYRTLIKELEIKGATKPTSMTEA
ncbi:TPA: YppF family protein [Bacillus luti]|nr:YppF family protein [Bacillus luti]